VGLCPNKKKTDLSDSLLGYTLNNWQDLLTQIENLAPRAEVRLHDADEYGHRYVADLQIKGVTGRQATVRTGWIVRTGEDAVRLVTLWIEGQ